MMPMFRMVQSKAPRHGLLQALRSAQLRRLAIARPATAIASNAAPASGFPPMGTMLHITTMLHMLHRRRSRCGRHPHNRNRMISVDLPRARGPTLTSVSAPASGRSTTAACQHTGSRGSSSGQSRRRRRPRRFHRQWGHRASPHQRQRRCHRLRRHSSSPRHSSPADLTSPRRPPRPSVPHMARLPRSPRGRTRVASTYHPTCRRIDSATAHSVAAVPA